MAFILLDKHAFSQALWCLQVKVVHSIEEEQFAIKEICDKDIPPNSSKSIVFLIVDLSAKAYVHS